MSNETMPEKFGIKESFDGPYNQALTLKTAIKVGENRPLKSLWTNGLIKIVAQYVLAANNEISRLTETVIDLRRQNAALKEFVTNDLPEDFDKQMYESAKRLGIIIDVDDENFNFAPWMLTDTAMPAPSKAEVAREFVNDIAASFGYPYVEMEKENPDLWNMLELILREWEDAGKEKTN